MRLLHVVYMKKKLLLLDVKRRNTNVSSKPHSKKANDRRQ